MKPPAPADIPTRKASTVFEIGVSGLRFKLAFHGWMDYHTGVVELSTGKTAANGSGRSTAQLLKTTLFKNMKEGS